MDTSLKFRWWHRVAQVAATTVAGLVVVLALGALTATPVAAHAQLVEVTPADGARLDTPPAEVAVTFNEPVDTVGTPLRVFGPSGARVDVGVVRDSEQRRQLSVSVTDGLPAGTYVMTWRVVSADGHPVRGASVFSVGEVAPQVLDIAPYLDPPGERARQLALTALRALAYLGVMGTLALGLRACWGAATSRRLVMGVVAGAAAAQVGVLVASASVLDGRVWAPDLTVELAGSRLGLALGLRLAAIVAAGMVATAVVRARPAIGILAAAFVAAAGSFTVIGHAAADASPLAVVSSLTHVLAVALWLAALGVLIGPPPLAIAQRVSRTATVAVPVLVVAGAVLALVLAGGLEPLRTSTYGAWLGLKVALVAAMVGVGYYQRRRLRRDPPVLSRLRGVLGVELLLALAVLGVTAQLSATAPPTLAAAGPVSVDLAFGSYSANLVVDPARSGRNEIHAYVLTANGRPATDVEDLTFTLVPPGDDIGPIDRRGQIAGPGHWVWIGDELQIPGAWEVTLRARQGSFESLTATAEVSVTPPGGPLP